MIQNLIWWLGRARHMQTALEEVSALVWDRLNRAERLADAHQFEEAKRANSEAKGANAALKVFVETLSTDSSRARIHRKANVEFSDPPQKGTP